MLALENLSFVMKAYTHKGGQRVDGHGSVATKCFDGIVRLFVGEEGIVYLDNLCQLISQYIKQIGLRVATNAFEKIQMLVWHTQHF